MVAAPSCTWYRLLSVEKAHGFVAFPGLPRLWEVPKLYLDGAALSSVIMVSSPLSCPLSEDSPSSRTLT